MIEAKISQVVKVAMMLAGVASLGACGASSDLTGTAKQAVSFSFTTRAPAAAAPSVSSPLSRADLVLGTNGELVLTKIQVVLNKLELTRTDAAACVSDDSTDDDNTNRPSGESQNGSCEDVSREPMVLDIPVDAAVHTAVNVPLTAGTYTKLEARLAPAASVGTANPDLAGASVRVTGTFNGTAFTFTSAVRSKIEMEFNPPLIVDATTQNTTINIDVSRWFKNASGGLIDPSTANAGGVNAALVGSNIKASFHAFEDDDKAGNDGGGHHGGSGNH